MRSSQRRSGHHHVSGSDCCPQLGVSDLRLLVDRRGGMLVRDTSDVDG